MTHLGQRLSDSVPGCECLKKASLRFRRGLARSGLNRLDRLPLLTMMIAGFISASGFFFGKPVSGKAFWAGVLAAAGLAAFHSWRRVLGYLGLMAAAWIVTAYTFTYSAWDPAICHFPMAQALVEGWNPVLNATEDGFKAIMAAPCGVDHILCAPKFPAIASACISKSTGLFTGTMFLPICVFYALFATVDRFARLEFGCSRPVAILFAFVVATPVELMHYVVFGNVDAVKYLSVLGAVFAFLSWFRTRQIPDAVLLWMFLATGAVSKMTGVGVFLLLGATALAMGFRDRLFRKLSLAAVVFVLVVGASPFLTQWIQNGSPFYPGHTFDVHRATHDLTSDFVQNRNDDARRMGWLARVVYAWFSPGLAEAGCRIAYDKPDFKPDLHRWPRTNGMGGNFCVLMCASLLALPFTRNRRVWAFCGIVFLLDNLAPLRYLGFFRYFPEMYAIPFVTFMGLSYNPLLGRRTIERFVRPIVLTGLCYVAGLTVLLAHTWFGFNVAMEAARQQQYEKLASRHKEARIGHLPHVAFTAVASRRMMSAGIWPVSSRKRNAFEIHYGKAVPGCMTMVPAENPKESEDISFRAHKAGIAQQSLVAHLLNPAGLCTRFKLSGPWPRPLFQPARKFHAAHPSRRRSRALKCKTGR